MEGNKLKERLIKMIMEVPVFNNTTDEYYRKEIIKRIEQVFKEKEKEDEIHPRL